ncbi:cytochrome c [Nitrobacter sp. NHB1]|uniref:c-type cytochrome n=1 Tax=Nitrobacter sp. NHB1 TaxID=3119830 RepID=UPI002FFEE2C2
MSMHKTCFAFVIGIFLFSGSAIAQTRIDHFGVGRVATADEMAKYFSIPPSGEGLPPGSGTAKAGAEVFANSCAACHGDKMQGNPAKGIGGDRLLGGRGSLASKTPVKTVESYWPYATTLFDYIKRAMPFDSPGSLKDDDVYALVAYILSQAKIIKPTEVMDAKTLPKVMMPNRDGFISDPRPELQLYR